MIRFYTAWSAMHRQKRTGWTLVAVAIVYIVWFLKARLFEAGPPISRKEWFVLGLMLVLTMLGTINIRMAEMRERRQQTMPLIDPEVRRRK